MSPSWSGRECPPDTTSAACPSSSRFTTAAQQRLPNCRRLLIPCRCCCPAATGCPIPSTPSPGSWEGVGHISRPGTRACRQLQQQHRHQHPQQQCSAAAQPAPAAQVVGHPASPAWVHSQDIVGGVYSKVGEQQSNGSAMVLICRLHVHGCRAGKDVTGGVILSVCSRHRPCAHPPLHAHPYPFCLNCVAASFSAISVPVPLFRASPLTQVHPAHVSPPPPLLSTLTRTLVA